MKKSSAVLVSSAFAGLLMGAGSITLTSCTKETPKAETPKAGQTAGVEKHACAGLNTCKGKGGCKGTNGQNECAGKGGCATVKHDCAGKNECKMQGGCGGKAGKNECAGKGGCKVPVQKH